jgi:hypothetical protein
VSSELGITPEAGTKTHIANPRPLRAEAHKGEQHE